MSLEMPFASAFRYPRPSCPNKQALKERIQRRPNQSCKEEGILPCSKNAQSVLGCIRSFRKVKTEFFCSGQHLFTHSRTSKIVHFTMANQYVLPYHPGTSIFSTGQYLIWSYWFPVGILPRGEVPLSPRRQMNE